MIEFGLNAYVFSFILIFISIFLYKCKSRKNNLTYVKGTKLNQKNTQNIKYQIISSEMEFSKLIQYISLNRIKNIALDVEYYKGEKYLGEICLIQITLPKKDTFILDMIIMKKTSYVRELLKNLLDFSSFAILLSISE